MKRILFCWILTLTWAATAMAQLNTAQIDSIRSLLQREMELQGIPGLSVAVMVDGKPAWAEAYGWADVENNVPMRTESKLRTASVCKLFTGVAAMKLAAAGRLHPDSSIHLYCPHFPTKKWPIAVRHLLTHTSGIRHYRSGSFGTDPHEFFSTKHYTEVSDALELFRDDSLLFQPGTRYQYSTYAVNLLGCVVQDVAGVPFQQFLEEEIFEPAGMHATLPDDPWQIIEHRARGYYYDGEGNLLNARLADLTNKLPGGGYLSTPSDLMRFCAAFLNGTFLDESDRERMLQRQFLSDGTPTRQGLSWILLPPGQDFHGLRVAAHGGATPGVTNYLFMLPDVGFAVAIMTNLERVQRREEMCMRIAEMVLDLK